MKPDSYGLLAAPPVRWLLDTEPRVKEAVRAFIRDEADSDMVEVAGPPPYEELARARRNARHPIRFPTIRLRMRKVRHHLTGEPGIEVTCSAEECDEIARWHNQTRLRSSLTNTANA